jgi:paraquat-inducible protein B
VAPAERQFNLYSNKAQADAAGFQRNIPMVTYFKSSVAGLARGSAVEVFGIQIGTVTDVHLVMEPGAKNVRARVAFELQPERVFPESELRQQATPLEVTDSLVRQGMRAVLESSNFLTGQKDIALEFVPNAPPATLGREGDALLLPSQGGGLDNITSSLSDIATKLDAIPFDEIGKNLNSALASLSQTIGGPDVRNALQKLSATLTDVQHLVHNTDKGMEPVLKKLPQMSADLQQALARANAALGEGGYGGNSDFQRSVSNLLDQVNDAARSIRLLVDFLDRHPEALIRGRTSQATER